MPTEATTYAEHYATSPYAAFDQEWRRGGSFGVEMMRVEQDGHEFTDPALPRLGFVGALEVGPTAELDFGDGWKAHSGLRSGQVDLQPANQECCFRIRDPHTILIASLSSDHVARHLDEVGIHADPFASLYAAMAGGPDALHLLHMMWTALDEGGPANDLLVDGCALALLGRFAGLAGRGGAWQVPSLDDRRLARAIDYIEAHLAEPIRMEDLAGVACLSLVHFSRAFKIATGQPPHFYLTGRRVARAKRLLAETHLTVMQVGHACGFNSPAHFAATFRARTGVSPTAYRAQMQD